MRLTALQMDTIVFCSKKRARESLLDDVPGISAARKSTLLQHSGSVERIKQLPAEQIASLPGISLTLAEKIAEIRLRKNSIPFLAYPVSLYLILDCTNNVL